MLLATFRSRFLFNLLFVVGLASVLLAVGGDSSSGNSSHSGPPAPTEGASETVRAPLSTTSQVGDQRVEEQLLEFDLLRRMPSGEAELAASHYSKARTYLCRMDRAAAAGNPWIALGPSEASAATNDPCSVKEDEENALPFARRANEIRLVSGAVSPDGKAWLGGAWGQGIWRGTKSDEAVKWEKLLDGPGGSVAVNAADAQVVYATQQGLTLQKSVDGGQSFIAGNRGIDDEGLLIAPLVIDSTESRRLWTGGRALWRTVDGAESWVKSSAPIAGSSAA